LIQHAPSGVNEPDDPAMPFKLEASLRPPEFMAFAFIGLYGGSEDIVVRSETKEALEKFLGANELRRHPRLRRLTITGPEGVIEQVQGR
jgi:hypothetical protein